MKNLFVCLDFWSVLTTILSTAGFVGIGAFLVHCLRKRSKNASGK